MKFKDAQSLVFRLLRARTYTDLRALEAELRKNGVQLEEDFILTEERRAALDAITGQITGAQGATVIVTGWYGSGKTTVLGELLRRFEDGRLLYGNRIKIDPIEIRLNEDNTASQLLGSIVNGIAELTDVSLVLRTYAENRAFLDLPEVNVRTVRRLVEELVSLDVSEMDKVRSFIKTLFEAYRLENDGTRMIGLIIDELENVTQAEREAEPKLSKLLQGLFESAVRELVDQVETREEPVAFVLFDIISRLELARSGFLRQDTLDRADAWTHDINLTRASANLLMRQLLRLYMEAVLKSKKGDDSRTAEWRQMLAERESSEDEFFTYPITRRVHRAFTHALLDVVPATGAILSFRAYQEGIARLLDMWDGTAAIDLGFLIEHAHELRQYFGQLDVGVSANRLLDEGTVFSFVEQNSHGVQARYRQHLARLVLAAVTKGSASDHVSVTLRDLEYLPEEDRPSEGVVGEVLRQVDHHDSPWWTVVGDSLDVNVEGLLSEIAEQGLEAERDWIRDALKSTEERRATKFLSICQASISQGGRYEAVVTNDVLELRTPSIPLLLGYKLGVDRTPEIPDDALWIGIELRSGADKEHPGLPIGLTLHLPKPLSQHSDSIEQKLRDGLQTRWDIAKPVAERLVEEGASPAEAFFETVKLSLLVELDAVPSDVRQHIEHLGRDFTSWFLNDLALTDPLRQAWTLHVFGFESTHELDQLRRMIRVLAWAKDGNLAYDAREHVHDEIAVFNTGLPSADAWRGELRAWERKERFLSEGQVLPLDKLPTRLRKRLEQVDDLMAGHSMSFSVIAGSLLGGGSITAYPTGQALLHLLLRLGAHSLDWVVKDDVSRYGDVQLQPKSASVKQARAKAAQRVTDDIAREMLRECLGQGMNHGRIIGELLGFRQALGDATAEGEIEELLSSRPSVLTVNEPVPFESPNDLMYVGDEWDSVRRYLEFLEHLSDDASDGLHVLNARLEQYSGALGNEASWLLEMKKLTGLLAALGKPTRPKGSPTLLRALAEEEAKAGGDMRAAARDLVGKFEQRAKLVGVEKSDERRAVVTWARALADKAVPSGLQSTLTAADLERVRKQVGDAEADVHREATALRAQAATVIGSIEQLLPTMTGDVATSAKRLKARLASSLDGLEALLDRVTVSGASILEETTEAIKEWEDLLRGEFEERREFVRRWLAERRLERLEDQVTALLPHVHEPLGQLLQRQQADRRLVERLAKKESEALDIVLALLAAVELAQAASKK